MNYRLTEIAAEYAKLAERSPTEIELRAWRTTQRHNLMDATALIRDFDLHVIATTDPEPYATAEDQAADLRCRTFRVSTAHCDHPVWSTLGNVAYRIIHDVIGHGSSATPAPFTVAGELTAWERQRMLPSTVHSLMVSYCETVGQLAYAAVTGDFHPTQPIGFLPFDPFATIVDDR